MTGPEHYRKADEILAFVARRKAKLNGQRMSAEAVGTEMAVLDAELAEAHVHATLALAAATAQNIRQRSAMDAGLADEWMVVTQ